MQYRIAHRLRMTMSEIERMSWEEFFGWVAYLEDHAGLSLD